MKNWKFRGVLPAALLLSVAACSGGDDPTPNDNGDAGDEGSQDTSPVEDAQEDDTAPDAGPDGDAADTDVEDDVLPGEDVRPDVDAADSGSGADSSDGSTEPLPDEPDATWETLQGVLTESTRPASYTFDGGFPTVLAGNWPVEGETAVDRARGFLTAHSELYPIEGENLQIRVGRVQEGDGETVVSWRQTFRGLPVHNGELVVNLDDTGVFLVAGRMLTNTVELDTRPRLAGPDAERLARAETGIDSAPIVGTTRLVVVDTGIYGSGLPMVPVLAWRVGLPGVVVLVNADDGSIVEQEPQVFDAFDLDVIDVNGEEFGLLCWFLGTLEDENAADEDEVFETHLGDEDVVQARLLHRQAYDFFLNFFGIDSYDNDGAQHEVYMHVGGEANASYNNSCDSFQYHELYSRAFDIVVHEVTHAVIRSSSNLIYRNESGALNESYADIMGAIADGNWTMGESAPIEEIRSFRTPEDFSHPISYSDYRVITDDNGGVHTNSSIFNHAFYMMAVGSVESGRTLVRQRIEPVPMEGLAHLFYETMRALPNSSTMRHAAAATIARAEAWAASGKNGFTARHLCDIRNAFEWTSLATGDLDCDGVADISDLDDDADGVFDQYDNCLFVKNPGQADTDSDRIGDTCDDDLDNDTILNDVDNCPDRPNPSQFEEYPGVALACCCDIDLDERKDQYDNCPLDSNFDQADEDGDDIGDVCDVDPDDDGIQTEDDNCPFVANPEQTDEDDDYLGDACDACPGLSQPGVAWSMGIPELGIEPAPLVPDADGDGTPDACDTVPFGTGIIATRGRGGLAPSDPIAPSGVAEQYGFTAAVGDFVQVPLAQCVDCPDYFGAGDGVDLRFDGLPSNVLVWITDELGNSRGRVSGISGGFTVPPVFLGTPATGESDLTLNVRFLPGFTGTTSFRITATAR